MSGRKGMRKYPVELKLEAIRLYYEEGKTRAEVTALLGIGNASAVKEWGQVYRREGISGLKKMKGRRHKSETEQAEAELERLRMENALLKKFHTELRKEVLAKRNIGSSITNEKNTQ
jgi:transposase-like protein